MIASLTIVPHSDTDIKPSRYVPLWWAFLPPKSSDTIDWLYNLGFQDMLTYLDKRSIPASPRARPAIQELAKNAHPYDTPRRISMHRFLGYDLSNLTNEFVAFVMDLGLLLLLFFVWKPIALMLIYLEVLIRMLIHCCVVIIEKLLWRRPSQYNRLKQVWECFTCVWSLSLLLRFFTPACSSVELRKHDKLAKISVLYRVFRHII